MREVRWIDAMSVRICLNHRVDDVLQERTAGRFDAVFIGIGAHLDGTSIFRHALPSSCSKPLVCCADTDAGAAPIFLVGRW
jgi:formate dehydrogenase (NADP+) beta subunit